MNGKPILYRDQYGNSYFAKTVKELREKVGSRRISKMYVDGKNGKTFHVGYVIGKQWLTAYVPYRQPA